MCAVYFRTGIWGIGIGYSRSFIFVAVADWEASEGESTRVRE